MAGQGAISLVRSADVEANVPPAHWNMTARTLASRDGRLRVQLCDMAPDGGSEVHVHASEEQMLVVTEGSLLVSDGQGRKLVAHSGDAVIIEADAPHRAVATGGGRVAYLVLTFPAAVR